MKRISLYTLLFLTIFVCHAVFNNSSAQNVGINGTGAAPSSRAMLDIDQIGKGILIPRMTKARRDTITSTPTSLLIFQTDNTAGYYFYSGSAWVPFLTSATGWSLSGNTGTTAGTDYLGTTDAEDLVFSTAGTERVRINGETNGFVGFVGLGTNDPQQRLHVTDDIILGGGQGSTEDGPTEHLKFWAQSKVWNIGVVNDAASANSDFFISQTDGVADGTFHVDPTGYVGIGTSTPDVGLELEGTSQNSSTLNLNRFSATINPPYLEFNKSRSGTKGTFTIVADNDRLGVVQFSGADGTDFSGAAEISALVDQTTPANNDIQGELLFKTGGTGSADINMVIRASGNVGIGTLTPSRLFEVSGDGATYGRITSATSVSDAGLELMRTGNGLYDWRITNISGKLRFQGSEDDYSTMLDVMTLETNGDVGIGTTNPNDELDVVGNAQVSGYLRVGNPTEPTGVGIDDVILYYINISDAAYWNLVEMYCETVTPEWFAGVAAGYQKFDNDGTRSIHYLVSPYIWLPHYIDNTELKVNIEHETDCESNWDGVYLEWDHDDNGVWNKITSWSAGGYSDLSIGGSTIGCVAANASAWEGPTFAKQTSVSNYLTQNPTAGSWVRFRLAGMEDASTGTGDYRFYQFWLYGDNITHGTSGFESGGIYAQGHIFAQSSSQIGDIAEYFPVQGETKPGDLISMDPKGSKLCYVSSEKMDPMVLGVHSTEPSLTVNSPSEGTPVGLTGRVPVNVTDENGSIKPGDYLTASTRRGYAMKATDPCFIVGRAMEELKDGTGQVLCMIGPGWYNPNPSSEAVSSGSYSLIPGKESVKVFDQSVSSYSRVFITMRGNPGANFWVGSVTDGSFEINLSAAPTEKVEFDYLVNNPSTVPPLKYGSAEIDDRDQSLHKELKNVDTTEIESNTEAVWTYLGNDGDVDMSKMTMSNNPPSAPPDPTKCWTWDPISGFTEQAYGRPTPENKSPKKDILKDERIKEETPGLEEEEPKPRDQD